MCQIHSLNYMINIEGYIVVSRLKDAGSRIVRNSIFKRIFFIQSKSKMIMNLMMNGKYPLGWNLQIIRFTYSNWGQKSQWTTFARFANLQRWNNVSTSETEQTSNSESWDRPRPGWMKSLLTCSWFSYARRFALATWTIATWDDTAHI